MARYTHGVLSGRAYAACVTSVAQGTSIAATAMFALFNPIGSGIYAVLWRVSMGYVSGTLGGGFVALCANTNTSAAAPTGGTPQTALPCLLGNTEGVGARIQPISGCTLPANATALRPLWSLDGTTGGGNTQPQPEDIDLSGEYVIAPGATLSFQASASAGALNPMLAFGAVWAEIPLEDLGVTHAIERAR